MPRKPRTSVAGIPEHLIQRGNNKQPIFHSDSDRKAYLNWLKDYAKKYEVQIHAWVLMTNHVHLLCTPSTRTGISQMMQSLGRMYVMYFNKQQNRTGTLWEGRYRSCLVQQEDYLLQVYRYIESNPVRAGMVETPQEHSWSSYQCNGVGKESELITPHPLYLALGQDKERRLARYRELCMERLSEGQLKEIRRVSNKGLAFGAESFIANMQQETGQSLKEGKRGRPMGWRKYPEKQGEID